ncbi:hypothetical protein NXY56_000307 [Leishmania guyanensis]
MRANLIEHVVLRRGTMEDLLLSLLLKSTASTWTAVTIADKLRGRTPPASRAEPVCTLAAFPDSLLRGPAVLPACGVTGSSQRCLTLRFPPTRVCSSSLTPTESPGRRCPCAGYSSSRRRHRRHTALARPSSRRCRAATPMTSCSTVCFSADGGLHYLSVGIAHFTEDWAPTLRVTLDTQDDEETGEDTREGVDASMAATPTANAIRVYTQISTMRGLLDTRFVNPNTLPPWTAMGNHTDACVLADLGQLTTVMLWTGFVGRQ